MALETLGQLADSLSDPTGQHFPVHFVTVPSTAGVYYCMNRQVVTGWGFLPNPTGYSAGGHVPTRDIAGVPPLVARTGKSLSVARLALSGSTPGGYILYDRIYAVGGFNANAVGPQVIVSPPAIPSHRAPNNGLGLELWVEGMATTGTTASNMTVSYTNSDGVAGRTTVAEPLISSFQPGRMIRLKLQDQDVGVSSIQSFSLSAATGTAGGLSLVLLSFKACFPIGHSYFPVNSQTMDFAGLGLPPVADDAALQFVSWGTTSQINALSGVLSIVAG